MIETDRNVGITTENRGVVISTEYFRFREDQMPVLQEVLKDPETREHVTGLWVPHSLLADHATMSHLTSLSLGNVLEPYPTANAPKSTDDSRKTFNMIIDTALAGGVHDMTQYVSDIRANFPGYYSFFTISPDAKDQGIKSLLAEFEGEERVKFLLMAVYPEFSAGEVKKFHGMDEASWTAHVSRLANEYGLGVAGLADLASNTIPGQYYLAMGVTHDGEDYQSKVNATSSRPSREDRFVIKRAATPEEALIGASNTELLVGRALLEFEGEFYKIPDVVEWRSEEAAWFVNLIKRNLLDIRDRAQKVELANS